ncbi:glycosyltransferase [Providencia manganoxydans]|uniref:Glycosyltransferase n=1 Tax=Providencia manganoxydans TaxID=2923283 RepID=A0ABX7AEG6_9GAMM|nr:glycosyltransferase [Providencia manganoxydans]
MSLKNDYPIVSIIIPIYNVEKYLSLCIESIIEQTYSNLEIILINDGSPDNSSNIINNYASKDKRIKSIHINNKGVSAARNLGLDIATGEYIVFVDADDYLSIDFVSYMLDIFNKTQCDFAMSKNCFKVPGDKIQIKNDNVIKISSHEASTLLMYPDVVDIGCWNKMFSTRFLLKNKIKFPENFYMGEGLNFIILAAQQSKCVGVGNKKVYYYRKDNMTSATTVLNVKKYINALYAIDNIEKNSTIVSSEFKKALMLHKYLTIFATIRAILIKNKKNEFSIEYNEYMFFLRKNMFRILAERISLRKKTIVFLYCLNPVLASKITKLLNKLK